LHAVLGQLLQIKLVHAWILRLVFDLAAAFFAVVRLVGAGVIAKDFLTRVDGWTDSANFAILPESKTDLPKRRRRRPFACDRVRQSCRLH